MNRSECSICRINILVFRRCERSPCPASANAQLPGVLPSMELVLTYDSDSSEIISAGSFEARKSKKRFCSPRDPIPETESTKRMNIGTHIGTKTVGSALNLADRGLFAYLRPGHSASMSSAAGFVLGFPF